MDFHSLKKQTKEYLSHGQSREAINFLERELIEHKEIPDNDDYKKTMIELCDIYNDLASELLASGDTREALSLLRKAEGVNINLACKVKTLNTFACYYRQIGKARIAESYLQKALNLQSDLPNTYLNLCAVLSELGKHDSAMMQAMQAVILMQDLLISQKKSPEAKVDESLMPIAYLNLGVEFEFLKRYGEALSYYKRAQSFAEKKLEPDHPVKKNAENAVKELTKKIGNDKKDVKAMINKLKIQSAKENNKKQVSKPDSDKSKEEKKAEKIKEEKKTDKKKGEKNKAEKVEKNKGEAGEKNKAEKVEKKEIKKSETRTETKKKTEETKEKNIIIDNIENPINDKFSNSEEKSPLLSNESHPPKEEPNELQDSEKLPTPEPEIKETSPDPKSSSPKLKENSPEAEKVSEDDPLKNLPPKD